MTKLLCAHLHTRCHHNWTKRVDVSVLHMRGTFVKVIQGISPPDMNYSGFFLLLCLDYWQSKVLQLYREALGRISTTYKHINSWQTLMQIRLNGIDWRQSAERAKQRNVTSITNGRLYLSEWSLFNANRSFSFKYTPGKCSLHEDITNTISLLHYATFC